MDTDEEIPIAGLGAWIADGLCLKCSNASFDPCLFNHSKYCMQRYA